MEAEDQTHDSSVDDISKSLQRFGMADYSMFIIMLVMCSCIGVYFGWAVSLRLIFLIQPNNLKLFKDHQKSKRNKLKERRNSAVNDYLMGGKDMKVFPVAMSLVATFISGITLLGSSTEVYLYGTQYCYILIAIFTMAIVMYYIIIPVFHDLQITSTYEVNSNFNLH